MAETDVIILAGNSSALLASWIRNWIVDSGCGAEEIQSATDTGLTPSQPVTLSHLARSVSHRLSLEGGKGREGGEGGSREWRGGGSERFILLGLFVVVVVFSFCSFVYLCIIYYMHIYTLYISFSTGRYIWCLDQFEFYELFVGCSPIPPVFWKELLTRDRTHGCLSILHPFPRVSF